MKPIVSLSDLFSLSDSSLSVVPAVLRTASDVGLHEFAERGIVVEPEPFGYFLDGNIGVFQLSPDLIYCMFQDDADGRLSCVLLDNLREIFRTHALLVCIIGHGAMATVVNCQGIGELQKNPVGTVPVLRGNHVVVGRHMNVVDYIEEDTRHQTFLQLVAVVVVPIAAETQNVDERADEIVDNLLVVRYQRFLVESIEHNPCISVARQQTAYCRKGIAYHRDEAPLALANAMNDDVGRNKQQVAGKEFYLAVVEIQAQIAVQTEEHHQEIDLDAFFFVGK